MTNQKLSKMTKALALISLSVLSLASVGCKKSESANERQISSRLGRGGSGLNQTSTVDPQTGQSYSNSTYITTDANYSSAFQTAIKSLASGQIDPQYVGYVNPSNGVILRAQVVVDSAGKVVTGSSSITIEIRDEYASQAVSGGTMPGISMSLAAHSGYAYGGNFQLLFKDSVGEIMLTGTFGSGAASATMGQVYFANFRNFDGTALSPTQYVGLGTFQMQTCGFFRCQ